MLDEQTKVQLKERLLEEKNSLESQIERSNQEMHDITSDQSNENTYSNHMADDGGQLQEIDRTSTIMDNLHETLKQVNHALERMEDGSYGRSEVSDKPIPFERLEALPWATRLVDE